MPPCKDENAGEKVRKKAKMVFFDTEQPRCSASSWLCLKEGRNDFVTSLLAYSATGCGVLSLYDASFGDGFCQKFLMTTLSTK